MAPHFDIDPDNGLPPLLLFHGFLMSQAIWDGNLDALRGVARCIRMELFGHARSPSPVASDAYAPESYFKHLESLRTDLGYDRWMICAHSLGASLALNYSLHYPKSVAGIVFTNSRSALSDPQDFPSRPPNLEEQLVRGGVEGLKTIPAHAQNMKYVPDKIQSALLADSLDHNPRGIAKTMLFTASKLNVRHRFHEISAPTLLINGTRERKFQPLRQWAEQSRPDLKIVDLDGGHSVNAEAPGSFNSHASQFISDLVKTRLC